MFRSDHSAQKMNALLVMAMVIYASYFRYRSLSLPMSPRWSPIGVYSPPTSILATTAVVGRYEKAGYCTLSDCQINDPQ